MKEACNCTCASQLVARCQRNPVFQHRFSRGFLLHMNQRSGECANGRGLGSFHQTVYLDGTRNYIAVPLIRCESLHPLILYRGGSLRRNSGLITPQHVSRGDVGLFIGIWMNIFVKRVTSVSLYFVCTASFSKSLFSVVCSSSLIGGVNKQEKCLGADVSSACTKIPLLIAE